MVRTALALAGAVLVLHLAGPGSQPRATRSAAADSLRAVVEPLFLAAKYDSILTILSGFIQRAEAERDSVLLGRAIVQRGRVSLAMGRQEDAERDIDFGIEIAEALRDTFGLMPAIQHKGLIFRARGDGNEATRCFERRLDLAVRVRSPVDQAWALMGIASMRHQRGDHEGARSDYLRAIALARPAGESSLETTALNGLGRVYSALGDPAQSARSIERAWVLSREVGDRVNEMWATNNLGVLEHQRGDLSRAEEFQRQAYELAREVYPQGAVIPAIGLANRARDLGDYARADAILQEAREFCRSHSLEVYLRTVDFYIAHLREIEGRPGEAASIYRRLLLQPDRLEAQLRDWAVMRRARILADSDSLPQAEALILDRLQAADLNQAAQPYMHETLSGVYVHGNQTSKALEHATRAREAGEQRRWRRFAAAMRLRESILLRNLGRREEARGLLGAAIDSLEAVRGGTTAVEWREVYGQQVSRDVLEAARVLLESPDSLSRPARERAFFDAMQRFKTRTLLDRISDPRRGPREIAQRWSRRPATMDDVQAVLAPGEVLLDCFVGRESSVVFAVTADSSRWVELPGPESPFAERVRLFRSILASADPALRADYSSERLRVMQASLGNDVLGNVTDLLARAERVFFAPDDFLAALPFGALVLRGDDDILMAGRDIVQVPSASVLVLQRAISDEPCVRDPRVVAIGEPSESRLAGARDEVADLARRYRSVDRIAGVENADAFSGVTGGCDVLHIAAHALVVDQSPWDSGIRLAPAAANASTIGTGAADRRTDSEALPAADSLLVAHAFRSDPYVRAWQIAQLSLPAKLAVLSACETAGGRATSGEGTLGMTAAFLSAGVPVVVSSLWPIDDRVTADVMRSFYRHLAQGKTVATALRLAQLDVRAQSKHAHPFYWAGFTVVGDGSMLVDIEERPMHGNVLIFAGLALVLVAVAALHRRRRHESS